MDLSNGHIGVLCAVRTPFKCKLYQSKTISKTKNHRILPYIMRAHILCALYTGILYTCITHILTFPSKIWAKKCALYITKSRLKQKKKQNKQNNPPPGNLNGIKQSMNYSSSNCHRTSLLTAKTLVRRKSQRTPFSSTF